MLGGMDTPEAAERAPESRAHRPAEATDPDLDRFWADYAVVLGILALLSGAFLVAMFVSLAAGRGTDPWGPVNDLLGGLVNALLAPFVLVVSRNATRGPASRAFVQLVAVACLLGATSGFLLVARRLSFEMSTAGSMVAIVVQVAWLFWLNVRLAADPGVPRAIPRFGRTVAFGLAAGIVLVGGSLALPSGSWMSWALIAPGVAAGAVAWIAWPIWYFLVSRHADPRVVEGLKQPVVRSDHGADAQHPDGVDQHPQATA